MILGVVLPYGAYNAPWTSHDLFMIDVGAVTHAQDVAIKVIHLAVYVVIAFSLHLNEPGWWVVLDSSVNVLNVPAFYSVKVRNSNCSEEITWLFSGIITSYDLRWVARGQVPSEVGKNSASKASGSQSVVTPRAKRVGRGAGGGGGAPLRTPSSPDRSRLVPLALYPTGSLFAGILQFLKPNFSSGSTSKELNISPITHIHKLFVCSKFMSGVTPTLWCRILMRKN